MKIQELLVNNPITNIPLEFKNMPSLEKLTMKRIGLSKEQVRAEFQEMVDNGIFTLTSDQFYRFYRRRNWDKYHDLF